MSSASNVIPVTDSDSESEVDEDNLPSRDECESRCQMFAEVTSTDTALAMFYLQRKKWDLEAAISHYFADQQGEGSSLGSSQRSTERRGIKRKSEGTESGPAVSDSLTLGPTLLQPEQESRVRVLSWNIDGLDPDNIQSRTEGACCVLLRENPEVIFLQEVVHRSLQIIKGKVEPTYRVITRELDPRNNPGAYFTAMLLRKDCTVLEKVRCVEYSGSLMSRDLMEVQCTLKEVPLVLMTSHLESTAEYSAERRRQLKIAFDHMTSVPAKKTVIFGGDLNLRDKEIAGESAKPGGVLDLWEETGKRVEAKFTWDLTINDNKQLGTKFQPRCRFDRLYIRHCSKGGSTNTATSAKASGRPETTIHNFFSPRGNKGRQSSLAEHDGEARAQKPQLALKPVYFELVGIQRLVSCRRFPSDHWGILAHLDIVKR